MHRLLLAAVLAVAPAAAFGQAARDNIDALIEQQAKANGVPASFVHAVVKRESNYNPNAKGGSALGLMQIKHATARSLGYTGDAAGLYDPATNLRYGVAYLAGAYRTAQGNLSQAYQYYNRGYYYAAKRQGISTEVASVVAPVAASASALASLFGGGAADARSPAASALAYAPTTVSVAEAPTETVEVPLPPRRPAALAGATIQLASLAVDPAAAVVAPAAAAAPSEQAAAAQAVEVPLPPRRPAALATAVATAPAAAELAELRLSPPAEPAAPMTPAAASTPAADTVAEAVDVPLPPRRPSVQMLAAASPRRAPIAAAVREATALPIE
ncbi:transglycosylase SLT domain-containing protein [Methylobacterium sp. A49B]|uniref:Lytic transglycosylase domain-containing protein n=1 Tax=Methylobacterium mesophilicum SR1.6/6 TaxID=908290 RepID=A0A6B9FV80_9HYPH|nr:transglycosylase SLT domain-containing protein [Methylobacterium mesophilicum]QGY04958.1 lytic transglycosylase domain-containing protein [Methylobacterium mesophilicum SR1.6/6]